MVSLKNNDAKSRHSDSSAKGVPLTREHLTQRETYAIRTNTVQEQGVEPRVDEQDVIEQDGIKQQIANKKGQTETSQLQTSHTSENLAVEAAIAIVINGIHYAVLMASPSELEYLALGFLFSEGLIYHSYDLLDWEITRLTSVSDLESFSNDRDDKSEMMDDLRLQLQDYDAYVIDLTLSQRCYQRIQAQRRQLSGRTGCGMCGMTGLKQALPDLSGYAESVNWSNSVNSDRPVNASDALKTNRPSSKPELETLLSLRNQIDAAQQTHQLTGAVHAAGTLFQQKLYLFEDVGRHNALDKLIGWQLRHSRKVECVVMTSRLSIELVQKAVRSQLPWLVGMSAPTSTAVRVAQRYGLGLAGFLRDNRVTYYSF